VPIGRVRRFLVSSSPKFHLPSALIVLQSTISTGKEVLTACHINGLLLQILLPEKKPTMRSIG